MQEKKYSSSYLVLEIVVQNICCNVIFVFVGKLLAMLGMVDSSFASFGLIPLMFIFMWQRVSMNPE
jgi:hypothetical protein